MQDSFALPVRRLQIFTHRRFQNDGFSHILSVARPGEEDYDSFRFSSLDACK
jgi:hypothetical protein